jgi:hypothetical protein
MNIILANGVSDTKAGQVEKQLNSDSVPAIQFFIWWGQRSYIVICCAVDQALCYWPSSF